MNLEGWGEGWETPDATSPGDLPLSHLAHKQRPTQTHTHTHTTPPTLNPELHPITRTRPLLDTENRWTREEEVQI